MPFRHLRKRETCSLSCCREGLRDTKVADLINDQAAISENGARTLFAPLPQLPSFPLVFVDFPRENVRDDGGVRRAPERLIEIGTPERLLTGVVPVVPQPTIMVLGGNLVCFTFRQGL